MPAGLCGTGPSVRCALPSPPNAARNQHKLRAGETPGTGSAEPTRSPPHATLHGPPQGRALTGSRGM